MKKINYLLLILVCMILSSCGNTESNTSTNTGDLAVKAPLDTFFITVEDVDIYIGDSIENIIPNLTAKYSYFEVEGCAFGGVDYMYTFNNFSLIFNDEIGEPLLRAIQIENDLVETSEGAYIGMMKEDIIDIYGDEYEGEYDLIVYNKNNSQIRFILNEGKVSYITLQLPL